MGIDPKQFYKYTLYEYRLIYARHLMEDAKAWEHTRLINYTLYCANTTDKKKPSLQDYFPLLTDKFTANQEVQPLPIDARLKMQDEAKKRIQMFNKK